MAFELFDVVIGQGLIQAVGHGRADTQLHQREHGEHIGKQAIEAQISLIKIVQEKHPGEQVDQNASQLPDHCGQNVAYGILSTRHGKPPIICYFAPRGAVSCPEISVPTW